MEWLLDLIPSAGAIVAVVVALLVAHRVFERAPAAAGRRFRQQLIMLLLTGVGVFLVILALPLGVELRGQLLGLVGILLSAAIALSSTTILGNVLAGVMLRTMRNFRIGDFIRTESHFGRVSERGLFHVEIQTEDRELTTLPNLFLVTHPVTTLPASGAIVSATVSLGYDVARKHVEERLLDAAGEAGLDDAFVHVVDLGDFAVTYRVAGLLKQVKHILSTRSRLRACAMDALHDGGVEIVSPSFMNTRAVAEGKRFIPERPREQTPERSGTPPESVVFDKAEKAASLASLREAGEKLADEIASARKRAQDLPQGPEREAADVEIAALQSRKERLDEIVARRTTEDAGED